MLLVCVSCILFVLVCRHSGHAKTIGLGGLFSRLVVESRLGGDRATSDVWCECGAPASDGTPDLHNVKHAMDVGIDPHTLFHWKDTTDAWKQQYPQELECHPPSSYSVLTRCVCLISL